MAERRGARGGFRERRGNASGAGPRERAHEAVRDRAGDDRDGRGPAGGDRSRGGATAGAVLDGGGLPMTDGAAVPSAEPREGADEEQRPAVENRWWVDSTTGKRPSEARAGGAPGDAGEQRIVGRLFRVGRDFDQDRARAHLTDSNLNWIKEANPPQGGWAYLPLTEGRSRDDLLARVKHSIRLPRDARGVLVDSGISLRIVATGTPVGERVVELTLGSESSFDAWVGGEWVFERVYRGRDRALREAGALVARYLAPGD